jgi:precorrin-6B methylase 2
MLTNLTGIRFIGDLSLEDADLLAGYARRSKTILEFGAGGSTQIMSQCGAARILSVETSEHWIQLTQQRLEQIADRTLVEFSGYRTDFDEMFNLVFVDGVDHARRQFAIDTWRNLRAGGVMIFHDTRRFQDFQNAAWVAQLYYNEISRVDVNAPASNGRSSNSTVLHKKPHEPYVNWNETENKPAWAYGISDPDQPLWQYQ